MRAPGVVHSIHTMEHVLHNISKILNLNPVSTRALNFYNVGDVTPYGQVIERSTLKETWQQLQQTFDQLKSSVDKFNGENRWVKRGVQLTPVKYGMQHNGYNIPRGSRPALVSYRPVHCQAGGLVPIFCDLADAYYVSAP